MDKQTHQIAYTTNLVVLYCGNVIHAITDTGWIT